MRYVHYLFIILSVFIFLSDSATTLAQSDKKTYKLVFSEEFNNKSSFLSGNTWSVPKREKYTWCRQISRSSKVVDVKNGKLICKAIPNSTERSDTAKMLTAAFSTKGKFAFQYGKVQVRMRTNSKEGNFPAAWLMPADGGGKPYRYGEIDIFETFGNDGIAHQTVHNHRTFSLGKKENHAFPHKIDVTKWHVYEVEWTPTFIRFAIDNETTGYYAKSSDKALLKEGQWTFDRPFYIILNQSVGEKGWHEPDVKKKYETEFDWVRVYQYNTK